MKQRITQQEAASLILDSAGLVFSVTFNKRSDGSERTMRAIIGSRTRKALRGGEAAYNPAEHALLWVYLMAGDEGRENPEPFSGVNRRSVPVEGITALSIRGTDYEVV